MLVMPLDAVQSATATIGTGTPVTYILSMTVEDPQVLLNEMPHKDTDDNMGILLQEPQRTSTPRPKLKEDSVCTLDETILVGNFVCPEVNKKTDPNNKTDAEKNTDATIEIEKENIEQRDLHSAATSGTNKNVRNEDSVEDLQQQPIPCQQLQLLQI